MGCKEQSCLVLIPCLWRIAQNVFYVSNTLILGLMKVHVLFVLWEKLLKVAVLNCYFCLNVRFSNEHSRSSDKADKKKRQSHRSGKRLLKNFWRI